MLLNRGRSRLVEEDEEAAALLPIDTEDTTTRARGSKYKAKLEDSPLGPKNKARRQPFVEVDREEGESLVKLALRFNVSVSEVKRLNNLINENEFHALKKIKIPVKPQSVLTEAILVDLNDDNNNNNNDNKEGDANEWKVEHLSSPQGSASGLSSPLQTESMSESEEMASREARKAKRFLKGVDQKLAHIKEKSISKSNDVVIINNDDYDNRNDGDLLLPSKSTSSKAARLTLYFCLLFIVVVTVLILMAAKYEFYVIDHETHLHHHSHQEIRDEEELRNGTKET